MSWLKQPLGVNIGRIVGLDFCHSENAELLLVLFPDYQLVLLNTNVGRSNQRNDTRSSPTLKNQWTQIDQVAIGHKWLQNYRSYWSTSLSSDHPLICSKPFVCLGESSQRKMQWRLEYDKRPGLTHISIHGIAITEQLLPQPSGSISQH